MSGQIEAGRWDATGFSASASYGTPTSASASINTKGTWTQMTSSTTYPTDWVRVQAQNNHTGRALIDVGVGAAAAEQVLIPDLHLAGQIGGSIGGECVSWLFPVSIPAGSRVSIRSQSSIASLQCTVLLQLGGSSLINGSPLGTVTAYGAVSTTSGATNLDPGATAHVDSAWVQLVAATTGQTKWVCIAIGHDGQLVTTSSTALLDLAIGAGGSEVEILSDIFVSSGGVSEQVGSSCLSFPLVIPAGVRLSARMRTVATASPDRVNGVVVYGVS